MKKNLLATTSHVAPRLRVSAPAVQTAYADDGDKNVEISDADPMQRIADMIADACARMDGVASRMDAMEENYRRMDARMDAADDKGDPKEPVADAGDDDDKAKKDAEEEEAKAKADAEAEEQARKDAEEKEAKEKAEADSVTISRSELAAMQAQIAEVAGRVPAILSDTDRERYAAIQERANPAFQAFGDSAPAPMQGETTFQYQRRLAKKLQGHSTKWKDIELSGIADEAALNVLADDIYADSIAAARAGTAVPTGHLRAIERHSGGHTFITYEGEPDAWMNRFAGHSQRATGQFRTRH